jgi:hypothetical protein
MELIKNVLPVCLGTHQADNYTDTVADLIQSYKQMGCNMSLNVLFLDCRLDFFLENLGRVSDEHGKRFHKDISTVERLYQDEWTPSMFVDNFCALGIDVPLAKYSRKSSSVTFYVKYAVCNIM